MTTDPPATRPLLFVDVDGVLNPFAARTTPEGFEELRYQIFLVRLAQQHGDWLRELSASFDLWWATTWEHDANAVIAGFYGMEPLPVVEFGVRTGPPSLWKLDRLVATAAGRRFAWIDDDIAPVTRQKVGELGLSPLLLRIDPAVGLRRQDVDELLRFARA